ncbi:MAG TPA: TasA family protein [Actinomycetota bacterium]|nr:TasA family protein [Actinomycetota bacterium]
MASNKKMILGIGALLVALALIGFGVFAAFTDTETTEVATDSGSLDITGASDIQITEVAPGDIAFRDLTIEVPDAANDGDLIQAIRISVPAPEPGDDQAGAPTDTGDPDGDTPGQSLLTGANGLRVTLATCSGDWTLPTADAPLGTDTAPADGIDDSATCGGEITVTQPEIPLNSLVNADTFEFGAAEFGLAPTATGTIPDGSTMNLIAQFRLPAEADNAYENASLTLDMEFEAVQRSGVNR